MQELISKITEKAGISPEQANLAIHTIKDFIKDKFPMMAGAVDNFFPASTGTNETTDGAPVSMGEMTKSFAKENPGGLLGGDIK